MRLVHRVILIFSPSFLSLVSYLTQLLRARMWLLGSPRVHVFKNAIPKCSSVATLTCQINKDMLFDARVVLGAE